MNEDQSLQVANIWIWALDYSALSNKMTNEQIGEFASAFILLNIYPHEGICALFKFMMKHNFEGFEITQSTPYPERMEIINRFVDSLGSEFQFDIAG